MAEINVVDQANNVVGTRSLKAEIFDVELDAGLVHRVYTALAHAHRAGTRSTKTRAEVSGGGKKPWKQKGTGRARSGSSRSSIWRHGGVAHGPKVVQYSTRINRKERQKALRMVMSDAVRDHRMIVLDKIDMQEAKTKEFVKMIDALSVSSGLFVMGEPNRAVELSARNVPHHKLVLNGQVSMHDVLKYGHLVVTQDALDKIEGSLS